jgi:predicted enzyme related to lactoylglutathione lyase
MIHHMKTIKTLSRIFVHDIDPAIKFYEKLFDLKVELRFSYAEKHLELAAVGNLLIIAGKKKDLAPFKETRFTILVDSLKEFKTFLLENGAVIIRDITTVPTGKNMTFRHPDGTIAEYVEHTVS